MKRKTSAELRHVKSERGDIMVSICAIIIFTLFVFAMAAFGVARGFIDAMIHMQNINARMRNR